jgi:hypothetical protein
MESNVPAIMEKSVNDEELLEFLGQTKNTQNNLQRLKINRESLDDDEKEIPVGTYSLYNSELGKVVFFKEIQFRPLLSGFQYRVWDNAESKYSNRSIIFKNWNEEALDEKGGVACGKVRGALKKDLTKDEEVEQKLIKCARMVWGLVSGEAVDNENNTVTVVEEPCVFYAQGMNYQIVDGAIDSFTRRGKKFIYHQFLMTTKREKRGSNTFYIAQVKIDATELEFTPEHFDMMKKFQETIDFENTEILMQYEKTNNPIPFDVDIPKATLKDLELNDELPETMKDGE